ncbi:MAG TPA: response regulator transcription factor [Vicinamibacterales bacterium]|jgi:two-component system response regulator CpxR|nr:response regulator transcription factor [Vicinamibacterales bacterium]
MPATAVLMVDDDVELCALVSEYLGGHGYCVSAVHDGAAGLRSALEGEYQLVILDVMLPVLEGFEVLRQLRLRSNLPVIMLTARSEEHDRVRGFGDGVDDYLVKPFAAAELLGRVRAILRRTAGTPASAGSTTQIGALTLDAQAREGFWNGAALGLTPTEFAVLDVLARAAGRVVSRDELAAVLYQREATPFERSLDVHVSHLRRKIEAASTPSAAVGTVIRTVRGVGYLCSVEP